VGRFKQYVCEQEEIFWDHFWAELDNDPTLSFDAVVKLMQPYEHRLIGDSINNRMPEMRRAFDDHVKGETP